VRKHQRYSADEQAPGFDLNGVRADRRRTCDDAQTDRGYNIGVRIIDDFLAKSEADKCITFEGTVQTIAGSAFRMFLGVTATVEKWNEDKTECSLLLEDNPMVDHVEIPEKNAKLVYCNMLCGVLRGALLQVSLRVQASIERDVLKGDDVTEIRLRLLEQIPEEYPFKDDE